MEKILHLLMGAALLFTCATAFSQEKLAHQTDDKSAPVVYFTKDISADGMLKVYEALGWKPEGKTGVKVSTGEPPASNYLRPSQLENTFKAVDGVIVECKTAYPGRRNSNAEHHKVAEEHGFTKIADFDLLDEEDVVYLPIEGAEHLTKGHIVGSHFNNYGSYLVISHFKGHAMAGFGGAIKNLSIGFGSGWGDFESGKVYIHSGGKRANGSISGDQIAFLESMAEAAKGLCDAMGKNIAFINVLNRLSVDCDCNGNPAEPDMHDIGIVASLDPLAADQAAIDMVYAAEDSAALKERIESRQGLHTLDHAAKINLGSRQYRLVEIE